MEDGAKADEGAEMSNSHSTRYGQGWRDCQQHRRELDAAEGIVNAMIWGAALWAVLALVLVTLWGVML
jgi:hypothetical protein